MMTDQEVMHLVDDLQGYAEYLYQRDPGVPITEVASKLSVCMPSDPNITLRIATLLIAEKAHDTHYGDR